MYWNTWKVDLSARTASVVVTGGRAEAEAAAADLNHRGTELIGTHFRYLYVAMRGGGAPFDDPAVIKACDDFEASGRHPDADGAIADKDAAAARTLADQMTAWLEAPCSEQNPMYPTPGAELERWCIAARDLLLKIGHTS